VKEPKSTPSHCSPGSTSPLPHRSPPLVEPEVVLVLVLVLVGSVPVDEASESELVGAPVVSAPALVPDALPEDPSDVEPSELEEEDDDDADPTVELFEVCEAALSDEVPSSSPQAATSEQIRRATGARLCIAPFFAPTGPPVKQRARLPPPVYSRPSDVRAAHRPRPPPRLLQRRSLAGQPRAGRRGRRVDPDRRPPPLRHRLERLFAGDRLRRRRRARAPAHQPSRRSPRTGRRRGRLPQP
jgi:hypothetical protein